ncbi:HAD-like domain-containing protein [Chytriomyces sp. MP71]|nr:HAD-like domain-containing protein [Chytriomyces sp. MP71]
MSTKRPVIAVDCDEVISATASSLVAFHNEVDPANPISRFESWEQWGGPTEAEISVKVRQFYQSNHFSERMQVIPGAKVALEALKEHYDLVVVTARPEYVQEETHKFLAEHFDGIFKEVHFSNQFLTDEEALKFKSRTKGQICDEIGAKVLVDDTLHHILECGNKPGFTVFLFDHEGEYAWNKTEDELPTSAVRVHQWSEIVDALIPPRV